MANIKVTGLSAITPPLDNGSLFLTSSYDGVSAYTSKKITLTQLRDEVYLMEAEDKISFDSSGTNKLFFQDTDGAGGIYTSKVGTTGSGIYFTTDGDGFSEPYIGAVFNPENASGNANPSASIEFSGITTGGDGYTFFGNVGNTDEFYVTRGSAGEIIYSPSQTYGGTSKNASVDSSSLSGQNVTINSSVTNSVGLGGSGYTISRSGVAYANEIEVVGATESVAISDAGSVSATEQDWIEVSVGGVTGYIRVFATK